MPVVSVRIPQMGEGLQEARLVEYLKKPGDSVRRDEPIYVMETDKAVTEVESPYAGRLVEWLVEPDSILPIGTEVAKMEIAGEGVIEEPSSHHGVSSPPAEVRVAPSVPHTSVDPVFGEGEHRKGGPLVEPALKRSTPHLTGNYGVPIPPRTRKYARDLGILGEIQKIPAIGKKLLPEDVDRFVAMNSLVAAGTGSSHELLDGDVKAAPADVSASTTTTEYSEAQLPKMQQTLNYRMHRGMQACIPAVIEMEVEWTRLAAAREALRQQHNATGFALALWCVAHAMRDFPLLRSTLAADGKTLRTYRHVNLGVAVAVENGLLRTAVVRRADTLPLPIFVPTLQTQIELVRRGEDQIDATTTVMVSNIGSAGVRMGIPVIVTPAVATIAMGQVHWSPQPIVAGGVQFRQVANITMTFDHRIVNGVGAAEFLSKVKERMESFAVA
jgi:pyruvate/2-oxoglutarate dehydrogenase complex dihydrolipoamide acyltransferase (E2) component